MKLYQILSILFIAAGSSNAQSQSRPLDTNPGHALLIGIGAYPPESEWEALHGDADVQLVRSTLIKLGFPNYNIISLINEEATKSKILQAFDLLKKQISPKSIVHVHFSGHGQQLKDKNNDEIDGYDEAFVPFDSPKYFKSKVNEGQNLLTDDQLDSLITEIRIQIGSEGQLFVSTDACHSGTSTRSKITGRGTDVIMANAEYITKHMNSKSDSNGLLIKSKGANANMAPLISMSSSSPNEKSYETPLSVSQPYGLFSYFLCKNLLINKPCLSYFELHQNITSNVRAYTGLQHPQIEGPEEYCVFNNQIKKLSKFIRVRDIISNNMVLIDQGILHHIYAGSEILFYSASIRDTTGQKYIAKGIVDESAALDADVLLDGNIPAEELRNAKAVVSKIVYGNDKTRLQLLLKDSLLSNRIRDALFSLTSFQEVDTDPDLYFENPEGFANSANLSIYNRDAEIIYQQQLDASNEQAEFNDIKRLLIKYQKSQQLKKLELENGQLKAELTMSGQDPGTALKDQVFNLNLNDTISFTIKNTGPQNFYFSLLEIRPDFSIQRIYPEQSKASSDYYLVSGNSYQSPSFKIIPPKGSYFLKLLLSANPIDFNGMDATRSLKTSNQAELGNWIKQISHGAGSAETSFGIPTKDELSISTYYVKIN